MSKRFPSECQGCKHLHSWDMSVDDITCYCDAMKVQLDLCDSLHYGVECTVEDNMDEHGISAGSVVKHFKRQKNNQGSTYLYKVLGFAKHTQTKQLLVVYRALYSNKDMGVDYGIYCRPYSMFMSEVDHDKHPDYKQKYRFEVFKGDD